MFRLLTSLMRPSRPPQQTGIRRRRHPDARRGTVPECNIDIAGRRTLTRPSSPQPTFEHGTVSACRLDALPLEIRQQIWGEVLGGRTFHLVMHESSPLEPGPSVKRIIGGQCLAPDSSTCDGSCRRLGGPLASLARSHRKFLLPLLLTSRAIYSEAIDLLYSSNTFMTRYPDTLEFLPMFILPQRVRAIRKLVFTWRFRGLPPVGNHPDALEGEKETEKIRHASWTTIWRNIATMQSLKTLEVRMDVIPALWKQLDPDIAQVLLPPIKNVTAPELFVLTLPFLHGEQNSTRMDVWDSLPCKIQRVGTNYFVEP